MKDGTRYTYGHAFVLLTAAGCVKAGIEGAESILYETYDLLESRFWDSKANLYVDEIGAESWEAISPYRGQNANMHTTEAMLCAFEATQDVKFLDRAYTLARRLIVDLAGKAGGNLWEHYNANWEHDWEYNKDDPKHLFKPWGYVGGHFTEWSKLLVLLYR